MDSEGSFICTHCSMTVVRDAQGVSNVYHAYCHEGVDGGFITWPRGTVVGIRLLVTDKYGSLYFEMDERIKLVTLMELYCSRREIAREM